MFPEAVTWKIIHHRGQKEKRRVTRNCQSWREPRRVGPGKKHFLENKKKEFDFDLEKNSFGPEQKKFGPGKQETGFDLEKQEVQVGPQVHLDPNWLPDIGWILVLHPVFMIYLQSHC